MCKRDVRGSKTRHCCSHRNQAIQNPTHFTAAVELNRQALQSLEEAAARSTGISRTIQRRRGRMSLRTLYLTNGLILLLDHGLLNEYT